MVQYPPTHTSLYVERLPGGKFRVTRVTPDMRAKVHNPHEGRWVLWQRNRSHLEEVPMSILLGAYNHTHTIKAKKFTSFETALQAGHEALYSMSSSEQHNTADEAAPEGGKKKRTRKAKQQTEDGEPVARGPRLTNIDPKPVDQIKPARAGSKIAHMIDLLAEGVFADDLKTALERKGRALSGRIYRVHGYGIASSVVDGKLFYKLVLPDGLSAPLDHVVPEPPKPPQPKAPRAKKEEAAEGEAKPKRARKPKKEKAAVAAEDGSDDGDATDE